MNIVDIVLGFVGGGAIGGGALYFLQQEKVTEVTQQYKTTRSDLDKAESELRDTKGQLKLLDVSDARIREIEGTYREEFAKLQQELEDTKARLGEMAQADPSAEIEASYQAQLRELQQGYEVQIEELRQTHQGQIQEILAGHQAEIENLRQTHQTQILELQPSQPTFAPELPFAEGSPSMSFAEPWDNMPDGPRVEFGETLMEENFQPLAEFTPEMGAFEGFPGMEESVPEMEAFGAFPGMEESTADMGAFEGFAGMEESVPEMEAFEGFAGMEESTADMGAFEGFASMEESVPEMEAFEGFAELSLEEPPIDESFFQEEEKPLVDLGTEIGSFGKISAEDLDFLNSLQSEDDINSIASLDELALGSDDLFSVDLTEDNENFLNLLPVEEEQADLFMAGDSRSSIEDLFPSPSESSTYQFVDPFLDDMAKATSNGHENNPFASVSESAEHEFFNMLDSSEIESIESLPSDENFDLPIDELLSEELFSDWDKDSVAHVESLESHP